MSNKMPPVCLGIFPGIAKYIRWLLNCSTCAFASRCYKSPPACTAKESLDRPKDSIFTIVPGIYRTRDGGYAYVKFINEKVPEIHRTSEGRYTYSEHAHNGTGYPVIGCKAQLMPDKTVQWVPNIMQAYALDGRCLIGKDQAGDIVAYDAARVVLIFRPVKGTPPPTNIDKLVLFRHPKSPDGVVEYQYWPYKAWMDAEENTVEWAELP